MRHCLFYGNDAFWLILLQHWFTIQQDRTTKHLGGNSKAVLSYINDFFIDEKVVLFDDILTKGDSILNFHQEMIKRKANVICSVTIGKTKHERGFNLISSI